MTEFNKEPEEELEDPIEENEDDAVDGDPVHPDPIRP